MNVVILSITVVLGMLDKVLLCAELSPGAESRRTWLRSLNSAIKASLVLLVHDKNVYNCATKNKTGHGSTKTVLLTGELLRLADLSFEQPGT
ncbi:hypothetical protein pipiens_016683, partial [Culex pipiens pipiens]